MPVTRSAALAMQKMVRQGPYPSASTARIGRTQPSPSTTCSPSARPTAPASFRLSSRARQPSYKQYTSWRQAVVSPIPEESYHRKNARRVKHVRFADTVDYCPFSPPIRTNSSWLLVPFCRSSSREVAPSLPPSPPLVPIPYLEDVDKQWPITPSHPQSAPGHHLPTPIPFLPPVHHLEQTPTTCEPEYPPPPAISWPHSAVERLDCHSLLDLVEGLIPTASLSHLAYLSSPDFLAIGTALEGSPAFDRRYSSPVVESPGPSTSPSATLALFQSAELGTTPDGRAELKVVGPSTVPLPAECPRGRGYLRELVALGLSFKN